MKLLLERKILTPQRTLGELSVDGEFFCYTMEDADRALERPGNKKIPGQTAIPRGRYPVVITFSNRFQVQMPLIKNVPGFEGIRIHPGNTEADTEGCILPGWEMNKSRSAVLKSRPAYTVLRDLIRTALERGESVELEIK